MPCRPGRYTPAAVALRRAILGALAALPLTAVELGDVVAHPDDDAFDTTLSELLAAGHVIRDDRDAALLRLPPLGRG